MKVTFILIPRAHVSFSGMQQKPLPVITATAWSLSVKPTRFRFHIQSPRLKLNTVTALDTIYLRYSYYYML